MKPLVCGSDSVHREKTVLVAPLPKSANPSRIRENADIFDFQLSSEDMIMLDSLDKGGQGAVTWNPVDAD